jgi:hypothetical protein
MLGIKIAMSVTRALCSWVAVAFVADCIYSDKVATENALLASLTILALLAFVLVVVGSAL